MGTKLQNEYVIARSYFFSYYEVVSHKYKSRIKIFNKLKHEDFAFNTRFIDIFSDN